MKHLLVTGGAGFIGSNFIRHLLEVEPEVKVINLDALTYAGSMENLSAIQNPDQHIFVHGNICNRSLVESLINDYQVDTIVHFAAESHVDRSILGPDEFVQTNIVGTFTLLETFRKYLTDTFKGNHKYQPRFHHISTDEVFGSLNPYDPPFSEATNYAPNSPYAASKAASDHLVRSYGHTYGLAYNVTNCSNNYGPYQFPEKLIPLMILNALEGNPLPVYGDGQQIRDWLFVEDHCEAILTVLRKGIPGETYIIGGNNQPSNLSIVQSICEILDKLRPESPHLPHQNLIQFVTDRPGHDRRYAMDITKIKRELGWEPRQSLESGLRKTVQWYLSNPDWVDSIRKQQEYKGWLIKNYDRRTETISKGT